MRTRGLERTAKPQRAAGGRSRFPGALGGDADPTALDQHGARSHSQAESTERLGQRCSRLPVPGSSLSAHDTLLKGTAAPTRTKAPGHAESLG